MSSWLFSWSPFTTSDTPLQAWVRSVLEKNNINKEYTNNTVIKFKDQQLDELLSLYKNGKLIKFLEDNKINKDYTAYLLSAIQDENEKKMRTASGWAEKVLNEKQSQFSQGDIKNTILLLQGVKMDTILEEYNSNSIDDYFKLKCVPLDIARSLVRSLKSHIEEQNNRTLFPVPTSVQYSSEFPVKIHQFEYPNEVPKEERLFPPLIIDHANLEEQTLKWLNSNFKSNTQRRHYRPAIIRGLVKTGKSAWLNHALPGIIMNYEPLKNVKKHFFRIDFDKVSKEMIPNSKNLFSELLERFYTRLQEQFNVNIPSAVEKGPIDEKIFHIFTKSLKSNDKDLYIFLYDELQAYFNLDLDKSHTLLKSLFTSGHLFCCTGSGIIQILQGVKNMTPNNINISGEVVHIDISLANITNISLINQYYAKKVYPELFKIRFIKNMIFNNPMWYPSATFFFALRNFEDARETNSSEYIILQQGLTSILEKFLKEYSADFFPMYFKTLNEPSKELFKALIDGTGVPINEKVNFNNNNIDEYLQPFLYIDENKKKKFTPSLFCEISKQILESKIDMSQSDDIIVQQINSNKIIQEFMTSITNQINISATEIKTQLTDVNTQINKNTTEIKTQINTNNTDVKTQIDTNTTEIKTQLTDKFSVIRNDLKYLKDGLDGVTEIVEGVNQKIEAQDIVMTIEISCEETTKHSSQINFIPVFIERNKQERGRFILRVNHTFQVTINLFRDEKSIGGTPIVRQINQVRIIGLLKSGLPLIITPSKLEGSKIGSYQICSFISNPWTMDSIDVDISKQIYCNLEIDYTVNSNKIPTQIYPIAFDIYKENEHFPAKQIKNKMDELWNKLPNWAQSILVNVVANVIVFSLKSTPTVGPLFGILLS